jgi:hypothetical protein
MDFVHQSNNLRECGECSMKHIIVLLTIASPLWMTVATLSRPAGAQAQVNVPQRKFYCGQSRDVPATMAQTSHGPVAVIHWISTLDEDYTPEYRCQAVSAKFQAFYDNGTLNYLTTGVVDQQNVICAAQFNNGPCTGVLLTLKPSSHPTRTLQRLLSIRDRAPNIVLNESEPQFYVSLKDLLEPTSVETGQTSSEIPIPASEPNTNLDPSGSSGVW